MRSAKTVSSLVPFNVGAAGDILFVAETREGIVGFIQAQASGIATALSRFSTSASPPRRAAHFAPVAQLLTHLHQIKRAGARYPALRGPAAPDHPLVGTFLEQGFVQLATEQILYSDDAPVTPQTARSVSLARPGPRTWGPYISSTAHHALPGREPGGVVLKSGRPPFAEGDLTRVNRDEVRHFVVRSRGWWPGRPSGPLRDPPNPALPDVRRSFSRLRGR